MRAVDLRVESSENPLGLDEPRPRFSWRLQADPDTRNQVQRGYQVVVESDGLVWDSGVVRSARSIDVVYDGPALTSRTRYTWRVQVWDQDERATRSDDAWFEMGLLEPNEWQARWIGLAESPDPLPRLEGAARIWAAEASSGASLRHSFVLPYGTRVLGAHLRAGGAGDVRVLLNEHEVASGAEVSAALRIGDNELRIEATDANPGGVVARLMVMLADGPPLAIETDDTWQVSTDGHSWQLATRVGRYGDPPWGRDPATVRPSPMLRCAFSVDKPVRQARLYSSALGVYEASLNSRGVSDDVLAPGWTDYPSRVPYQTYDVTAQLNAGDNVLGVRLGDGWYAGYLAWFGPRRYGDQPLFIGQLEIDYADGTRQVVVSDAAWQGATGEIVYSDPQMGETVDARLRLADWDAPGFDSSAWQPAVERAPLTRLEAEVAPRMAVQADVQPVSVSQLDSGAQVFDLGQNMVGWVRMHVSGERGRKVILRFAEVLNPDGTLFLDNLRSAQATDEYILSGDAEGEVFEPRFTHHGFRYVEVSNAPGDVRLVGRVVYARMPLTGSFECSNPDLNQLQQNIQWGQRGNFLSVPTDCPQRDERLGWTGDAQVFCATASFNMDVQRFLTKWMTDVTDAQLPSGAITHFAPNPPDTSRRFGPPGGAPGWADAVTIMPWTLYQLYGDERLLARSYDACARWIAFMERESDELIRPAEGFGDWLSVNAETPKDLIGTAYFSYSTKLMAQIAITLGRRDDAERYNDLARRVRTAFRARFIKGGGRLEGDTQTAYVLALFTGMFEPDETALATQRLARDIRNRNVHLSTGFLGTPWLLPVLEQYDQLDLAYELLLQESMPSWLYPIRHGATTMWERWDSWTDGQGPARLYIVPGRQPSNMNSFNHYAYGSVGDWLYRTVGGIECAAPGYERVRICPRPGGGITWAKTSYDSARGRITCNWRLDANRMQVEVEIPPNTTAEVNLGSRVEEIGSGRYEFSVD